MSIDIEDRPITCSGHTRAGIATIDITENIIETCIIRPH
jgi:hypothetical protein